MSHHGQKNSHTPLRINSSDLQTESFLHPAAMMQCPLRQEQKEATLWPWIDLSSAKMCSHSPDALSTLGPALEGLKAFNTTNTSARQMSSSHSLNPTKHVSHAKQSPNICLNVITDYITMSVLFQYNSIQINSKCVSKLYQIIPRFTLFFCDGEELV